MLFSNSAGDGGSDEKDSLNGTGRFFRLLCLNKSVADTGYSVRDFLIYGYPLIPTSVGGVPELLPQEFQLYQNFPNPFNPATTIAYGLPVPSRISLKIYNVLGQLIDEPVSGEQSAGQYELRWNSSAASGLYFYTLEAVSLSGPQQRSTQQRKMLKLK